MSTFISFDSTLNQNKCFQNTPPSKLNINNLPPLSKEWLDLLENKCREIKPNLTKNIFFKHIGDTSEYKSKKILLEQLSLLFHGISGHFVSQRGCFDSEACQLLLLGLTEDIQECTQGFHIRVNKLVNSLHVPKGLDQLLYLVRQSFIQEIASRLTVEVPAIYQVHVVDRVIRVAEKLGLGITPNIKKDIYKSSLSGKQIRKRLKFEFEQHYTPFKIPFLLAEQLQAILSLHHYQGAKSDHYNSETAEDLVSLIKNFFSSSDVQNLDFYQFFIRKLDSFDELTLLYDLNWPLIRQLFFKELLNEKYFINEPQPTHLIAYAYFQTLLPEKADPEIETRFINNYLESKNYNALLDDFDHIQTTCSDYWQKLIKNPIIVENIDQFFEFFGNQTHALAPHVRLKGLNQSYALFFLQTKKFILSRIIKESAINLSIISDNLLFKAMKFHPEIIEELLNLFLKKYNNQPRHFFNLLIKQNSHEFNLLMQAARYHPPTLQKLLLILNQQCRHYEDNEILALFLSQNNEGWSLFTLAARYDLKATPFIFDFIQENPRYFDLEILNIILNQKVNAKWGFLELLIRYQSQTELIRCLDFISSRFQHTQNKDWLALILNKEYTGNLLHLATQSTHDAFRALLNFISRHSQQLESETLQQLFLETNDKGWNCLHQAAYTHASHLKLIFEFIGEHSAQFNAASVCRMLLAQNQTQHNFLHFAVSSMESVESTFRFLKQHIDFFDKSDLQQLLLQKNCDGWNCLSASYRHSLSSKMILDFINDNPDKFPQEVVKEIILQKNKHNYTCLHLTAHFQPDSLRVILNFIEQRFELFVNDLKLLFQTPSKFQRMTLFQASNRPPNLLELSSKHQPESVKHFSSFLNNHANSFNLKKPFLKNFINQTVNKNLLSEELAPTTSRRK